RGRNIRQNLTKALNHPPIKTSGPVHVQPGLSTNTQYPTQLLQTAIGIGGVHDNTVAPNKVKCIIGKRKMLNTAEVSAKILESKTLQIPARTLDVCSTDV